MALRLKLLVFWVVGIFMGFMVCPNFIFASSNCFVECMQVSGCWSPSAGEGDGAYCSGTEARCETDCRDEAPDKSYGAIAYSVKDDAYGYSDSWKDQKSAEKAAIKYCSEYGKKCKVEVWFYNSCGAVASNGKKVGWGHADTLAEAEKKALKSCKTFWGEKKCEVKASHCSS